MRTEIRQLSWFGSSCQAHKYEVAAAARDQEFHVKTGTKNATLQDREFNVVEATRNQEYDVAATAMDQEYDVAAAARDQEYDGAEADRS